MPLVPARRRSPAQRGAHPTLSARPGGGDTPSPHMTKTQDVVASCGCHAWVFGWKAMGRCADGLANTKDLLDSRSLVYYSLTQTIFLGQRFLWALPLFQHTPGHAFVQCLVIHTGAVGEEELVKAKKGPLSHVWRRVLSRPQSRGASTSSKRTSPSAPIESYLCVSPLGAARRTGRAPGRPHHAVDCACSCCHGIR